MESVLESSRHSTCWLDITDVGGGSATLYVLNGGLPPPMPVVGDIAYNFEHSALQIFKSDAWKTVTIQDVRSSVWHPKKSKHPAVLTFSDLGLPFWMPLDDDEDNECCFETVENVLERFKERVDSERIHISEQTKRGREERSQEQSEDSTSEKRPRLTGGRDDLERATQMVSSKEPSRFVTSSRGVPDGTPTIRWRAGVETYMPFVGIGRSEDYEGIIVKELASRACVEGSGSERCSSDPAAFRVRDLMVELELDPVLKNPHEYDQETVDEKWNEIVNSIREYMSTSTTVVVRGCTQQIKTAFSKASLGLLFGDLGFRAEWVDGFVASANRDRKGTLPTPHKTTTMEEFVDLADDPTVCGNFLDGKELNPCPPIWTKPLLDSTIAWEHTAHLGFVKEAKPKNQGELRIQETGPTVLRTTTWTSQAWRLVTHPGFLTLPHHDCCGMGTFVVGNAGAKMWAVMRPKRENCPSSLKKVGESLAEATDISSEGKFADAEVVVACLEDNDVMFQPPGVLHTVYTTAKSIFTGGYFYNYDTMHLTRAVLFMKKVDQKNSLTNDHRAGFLRTLCRMVIALRYRSKDRKIGKRSLLSLLLIILEAKNPENVTARSKSTLADEERGELAFASECATYLLRWMDLTMEQAKVFVDSQGPYYFPGKESVIIPAMARGLPDPIFPNLNSVM